MAKLNKNETYEKKRMRVIYKSTAVLIVISIVLSAVFINLIENKSNSVAFSDNMFFAGTLLFAVSIISNLVKKIYVYRNRKLLDKDSNKDEKAYGEVSSGNLANKERKLLLIQELFVITFRSFLVAGIVSIVISVVFALLA